MINSPPNVTPWNLESLPPNNVRLNVAIPKKIRNKIGIFTVNSTHKLSNGNKTRREAKDLSLPLGCTSVSPKEMATIPNAKTVATKASPKNLTGINTKAMHTVTFKAQRLFDFFTKFSIQKLLNFLYRFERYSFMRKYLTAKLVIKLN